MIMMTVKAMINFLFYQIWHFAATGSFYYQFHSQMSRDLFCFDFPNTNLHFFSFLILSLSLMFFNIANLSIYWYSYYLPCTFTLSLYIYVIVVSIFSLDRFTCIYIYDLVLLILFKFNHLKHEWTSKTVWGILIFL